MPAPHLGCRATPTFLSLLSSVRLNTGSVPVTTSPSPCVSTEGCQPAPPWHPGVVALRGLHGAGVLTRASW